MYLGSKKMPADIFKTYKKSIESVDIRKTERGSFDEAIVWTETVDAIVKRRNSFTTSVSDSEDYTNNTSLHFRVEDKQYIEQGNFVKIDGVWRVIEQIKDGKNFRSGDSKFILAYVGNQIYQESNDIVWS